MEMHYKEVERNLAMATLWTQPFRDWLISSGIIRPDISLLDYGCGYFDLGLSVMGQVKSVHGYDPSEKAREICRNRIKGLSSIRIFDTPEEIPEHCYDVIVVNSVIQYMTSEEFQMFLSRAVCFLREKGSLIISDIIPPKYSPYLDGVENFLHAASHNLAFPMLRHLTMTATKGGGINQLSRYSYEELEGLANASGLLMERLEKNMTPSQRRYSVLLKKRFVDAKDLTN